MLKCFFLRSIIARLLVDSLPSTGTANEIRTHLAELPSDPPATYRITMERIKSQEPALAELSLLVLAWVYFARKTLTITQLLHAVSFRPEMKQIAGDDLIDEDQIILACGGLVSLAENKERWELRTRISERECQFSRES